MTFIFFKAQSSLLMDHGPLPAVYTFYRKIVIRYSELGLLLTDRVVRALHAGTLFLFPASGLCLNRLQLLADCPIPVCGSHGYSVFTTSVLSKSPFIVSQYQREPMRQLFSINTAGRILHNILSIQKSHNTGNNVIDICNTDRCPQSTKNSQVRRH